MFSPQYVLDSILPLSVAAYDCGFIPTDWNNLGAIQPKSFGFVAQNGPVVTVVFRGTRTPDEWVHDFDFVPTLNPFGPGRVHLGFLQEYLGVRDSVWKILQTVGYDSLIIIGHSLGAPMANYCAADIAKNAPEYAARVVGYTFEGPKPGDHEFVADFNTKFPVWWRIQNIRDIIPTLPPPPIFDQHEGTTIWVDGGFTTDVHIAHGLDTGCRPGLKGLIKP